MMNNTIKQQPSGLFHKKIGFRNFTKFPGNDLCQSLYFDEVAGLRPEALLKKIL